MCTCRTSVRRGTHRVAHDSVAGAAGYARNGAGRAFAFLVRASSHSNIKLRDIAQEHVDQCYGE